MLDLKKIIQFDFPETQYFKVAYPKKQIVLHHTASGPSIKGNIDYFLKDALQVATAFFVGHQGEIGQLFSSKYYAYHLGIPAKQIKELGFADYGTRGLLLHKESIGIELTNWGGLTKNAKGQWQSYAKVIIPDANVQLYPDGFRGYKAYEKYTPAQILALKDLLLYLCDTYSIDKSYQCNMFEVNRDAIGGKNGIWSHTSYRPASDKQDIHPQPEMIAMLKSLK